jgi:hypothetical protein
MMCKPLSRICVLLSPTTRLCGFIEKLGWKRMTPEDVTLPNELSVKRGDRIVVDSTHMWHPDYYQDTDKFDRYRFVRMRETQGEDHIAHLMKH